MLQKNADILDRLSGQRGTVIIIVAICITMLLGFVALVVDLGNMFRVRNELQNAADAASLAGAQELDRTLAGITRAQNKILEFSTAHQANGSDVNIDPNDMLFGHWHFVDNDYCAPAPCFQSFGPNPDSDQALATNAVKVITRRDQTANNSMNLFFAGFLGHHQGNVNNLAVAVGGGPYTECGFPLVLPDCALDEAIPGTEGHDCDYCMRMQDSTNDNAGWTTFQEHGGVNGPDIAQLIRDMCYIDPNNRQSDISIDEEGECANACTQSTVGDTIQVGNGNGMNDGNNNFCPVIQRILTRGVEGGPAYPFKVKVPVIDTGQSGPTCNPQFSGTHTVDGYATLTFYGAKCTNEDEEVRVADLPAICTTKSDWPPPSGKYIIAALDCGLLSDQPAGGLPGSIDSFRVRLVQ